MSLFYFLGETEADSGLAWPAKVQVWLLLWSLMVPKGFPGHLLLMDGGKHPQDLVHRQVSAHSTTKMCYFLSPVGNNGIFTLCLAIKINNPQRNQLHQSGWTTLCFLSNIKENQSKYCISFLLWLIILIFLLDFEYFYLANASDLEVAWSFHQPSLWKWNNPK